MRGGLCFLAHGVCASVRGPLGARLAWLLAEVVRLGFMRGRRYTVGALWAYRGGRLSGIRRLVCKARRAGRVSRNGVSAPEPFPSFLALRFRFFRAPGGFLLPDLLIRSGRASSLPP